MRALGLQRKVLTVAAALAGLLMAVTLLTTVAGIGPRGIGVAVADVGEAVAALGAAAACAYAAMRARGSMRPAWLLFAAAASAWGLGEVVWSVYEVGLGMAVPFPSAADAGFLAFIPLAAAGALALPCSPHAARSRVHAVLDAGIVATSTLYFAWAAGLERIYGQGQVNTLGSLLALVYPCGDLFVLSLLAMALLRRRTGPRGLVTLLMSALACNLVADAAFAYLNLSGTYGVAGSVFDIGWLGGFTVLGLTALARPSAKETAQDDGPIELWQLAMPWLGVLAVIGVSVWAAASGHRVDRVATGIGSGMGVFFLGSQFLALDDSRRLLLRSRRAESAVRERTALLAEIIGRAPLGIGRTDGDLRFIDANPRLAEMLEVPAKLLVGAPLTHFVAEADVAAVEQRMGLMKAGALTHAEVDGEMRSAAGREFWAHRSVSSVFDEKGQFRYALVMFEDVTKKHEVEEAEHANRAELERINRLKSEFMSMVSHEFRTALTGIQGYSEVLATEEVAPEEVMQFAGDINSEALRINRMISEMLDLDRIESGRIQLHRERLDLNALVSDVTERSQVTTSSHPLLLALDQSIPAVDGDKDRLTQVVANLLSNAIKYSPGGGDINISTRATDGDVEVCVTDHGQGIPQEFIGKIFGRYERYEGTGKAQVVGTGLGLAISQQIVQLHGGRIWVESKVGAGSSFHFTIPRPSPNAEEKVA